MQSFMTQIEKRLPDSFRPLWRRRSLITTIVGSVTVLSIVISLVLPKWYQSTAVILPTQEASSGLGMLGGSISAGVLVQDTQTQRYISILKSRVLAEKMIARFNLQERYEQETIDETIEYFRDKCNFAIGDEMQVMISILDKDQDLVASMTNFAVATLDSINIALSTGQAANTRRLLASRLEAMIDTLTVIEQAVVDFMDKNRILNLEEQVRLGLESAAQLQLLILEKELALDIAREIGSGNSARIDQLERELEILHHNLADYQRGGNENNLFPPPDIVPELGVEMERFRREIESTAQVLTYLAPEYEKAKLEEARTTPDLQILDRGVRPDKKARPRRRMIVLSSFFLSFLLTAAGVLILDREDV